LAKAVAELSADTITLGVRPEHLSLAGGSVDCSSGDQIWGEVVLVEELGADAYLRMRVGGGAEPLLARTEGKHPPRVGEQVCLRVSIEDLFAFETDTGNRVGQ
jgi:multiple sugar transport system ATP-binding protein